MATILISGVIVLLFAFAVRKVYKDSKGGGCTGCSGCSGKHEHEHHTNCQHGHNIIK